MPDLLFHALVSRIVLLGRLKKYMLLFLVGSILPDVLTRLPMFFLGWCYQCSWFIGILHAPIPLLLVALILSLLFKDWKTVFWVVILGVAGHLFLDAFQKHIVGGYFWLFPFSFWSGEWGLVWPEASLSATPFLLLVVLILYSGELYLQGRRTRIN